MVSEEFVFSSQSRRQISGSFSGGHITSDAGVLLFREIEKHYGLIEQLAQAFPDTRDPNRVQHSMTSLLSQRLYGLMCGYEDLNDHDHLREDLVFQTAVDRDQPLAGKSTLCRMEQKADRAIAVEAHHCLWTHFVDQHETPPEEIVLDFDATDIPIHGDQEGKFFHGYYDRYCFLPLYVFCGRHLLVSYLRPSDQDPAKHSWAILALLVRFLRRHWPKTRIVFRGDGGFCRPRMLDWCDRQSVDYLVGMGRNSRLVAKVAPAMEKVKAAYERSGEKMSGTYRFLYSARSWKRPRLMVARLEYGEQGPNPRFVISSRWDEGHRLYYEQYCARGDMENRIKDQQLDLFAKRTSSSVWWGNQWRLILSGFAYVFYERLRDRLTETPLARMTVHNLRLKLIKVGAVVLRNTRRIRLLVSEAYAYPDIFSALVAKLRPT